MEGLHRPGRTDRSLLWGTAALIAFTLSAVTVARMDGEDTAVAESTVLCYNSAGVGSPCLSPPPPLEEPAPAAVEPSVPLTVAGTTAAAATTAAATTGATTRAATPAPARPSSPAAVTVPAWRAGVAYARGQLVSYDGGVYSCIQPHTSQSDWSPVVPPAVWGRVSASRT